MREEVREVDFGIAMRGYDRAAVDRYVEQVNQLIAELEISSSPESAVRRALEEVSEETGGLLQRAHETAEEITARSRAKADDRLQLANMEAEELTHGGHARGAGDAGDGATRDTGAARDNRARRTRDERDGDARSPAGAHDSAA